MSEIDEAFYELDILLPGRTKKPRIELAELRAALDEARVFVRRSQRLSENHGYEHFGEDNWLEIHSKDKP